ncbi:arabinan endo-1,5-alpha-L-arabinosidase [Desertivirga brevis]|uniref:arabinan endo-1,5-alpha-L-arabinosidase n=1 Tax=Desertivirga brevis TaxID=2810310 RepID=UPI001A959A8F|nr:arabinan endo-1,5-alpha-L-arabinosidase [Pedobacter sp. SYSU D00873]
MTSVIKRVLALALISTTVLTSCKDDKELLTETDKGALDKIFAEKPFNIDNLSDRYDAIGAPYFASIWGSYNVHDPSIIKEGDTYYCYSTDVAVGGAVKPGIQVRQSKDLVNWKFVGWASEGNPKQAADYIKSNGGTPFDGVWAPYILKVGTEYRLYYSLSSPDPTPRLSAIGLLTSTSPTGPWTEKGLVVVSKNDASIQTNAIDPTVVITPQGEHYMYYGSSWDGIYVLKLNATTGLASVANDKGKRIAHRGVTGGMANGNIEGPEIIYNPQQQMYYLFISYDWLSTKYNVRVARSKSPTGPFKDVFGNDVNRFADIEPVLVGPYAFNGHQGWQGTAHCSVFSDGNGQYFMAHQGRPAEASYFMNLHVRRMFWLPNGWPAVSPERYANVPQTPITRNDIVGKYEKILHFYDVVPGYATEQTDAQIKRTFAIDDLRADGTIGGNAADTWTFNAPILRTSFANGAFVDSLYVSRERDWENKKPSTIVYSGRNSAGNLSIWGKKIE